MANFLLKLKNKMKWNAWNEHSFIKELGNNESIYDSAISCLFFYLLAYS